MTAYLEVDNRKRVVFDGGTSTFTVFLKNYLLNMVMKNLLLFSKVSAYFQSRKTTEASFKNTQLEPKNVKTIKNLFIIKPLKLKEAN